MLGHEQKDALIVSLHAMVAELTGRVTELEARLSMDSSTSAGPASSDGLVKLSPKDRSARSGKRRDGQPRTASKPYRDIAQAVPTA